MSAQEYFVFASFSRALDLPMACKEEEPDFVLKASVDGQIGIELTEYFQDTERGLGSKQERVRRLRVRLIDTAMAVYRELLPHTPMRVTFLWWDSELSDRTVNAVAGRVVKLVIEKTRNAADGYSQIPINDDDLARWQLDEHFSDIMLCRCRPGHGNMWYSPVVAYPYTTPDRIQGIIAEKEEKLGKYRQKCSRVWLLIHGKLGSIEMSDEVLGHTYETDFERVYLFDVDGGPVALRLARPGHAESVIDTDSIASLRP
jgi:hypothetical protein